MKLKDCLKCVYHIQQTADGVECGFYPDMLTERVQAFSIKYNTEIVFDCPKEYQHIQRQAKH